MSNKTEDKSLLADVIFQASPLDESSPDGDGGTNALSKARLSRHRTGEKSPVVSSVTKLLQETKARQRTRSTIWEAASDSEIEENGDISASNVLQCAGADGEASSSFVSSFEDDQINNKDELLQLQETVTGTPTVTYIPASNLSTPTQQILSDHSKTKHADSQEEEVTVSLPERRPLSKGDHDSIHASPEQSRGDYHYSSWISRLLTKALGCFSSKDESILETEHITNFPREGSLKRALLPPSLEPHKKTLVLDLDETLVHSSFQPTCTADFSVAVKLQGIVHHAYVQIRPGVREFLELASRMYELVVFTASIQDYADPVISRIDKSNRIQTRLFREHCLKDGEIYIKDLSMLGRSLDSVIIVDNSPHCYSLQPSNAIAVASWFHNPADRELYEILPLLEKIHRLESVYELLNPTTHWRRLLEREREKSTFSPAIAGLKGRRSRLNHSKNVNNSDARVQNKRKHGNKL